jgi:hypothetical protein
MENILKLPASLLAVALLAAVLLLLSTLYFGPMTFNGSPVGFQDTTWRVKGWQLTDETTATQNVPATLPVKSDEGFCFLTGVQGAFWGDGQNVAIVQSGKDLSLMASSDAHDNAGLVARARCVRLSQHALKNK